MDLTIMGSHSIPFEPLYVVIPSYTAFINAIISLLATILAISLNIKKDTLAKEVKASMVYPLFGAASVVTIVFALCFCFSFIDNYFNLIDFGDWFQVQRTLEPVSLSVNIFCPLITFLSIWQVKSVNILTADRNIKTGKFILIAFFLVFTILAIIESYSMSFFNRQFQIIFFLSHVGLAFAIFLYSFAMNTSRKVSFLRWISFFLLISCFNFAFYRPLLATFFIPSLKGYTKQVATVLEEEKARTGIYPERLPINDGRISNNSGMIKNMGFYIFYGKSEGTYELSFMDQTLKRRYAYNSTEKKLSITYLNIWY